MLQKLKERKLFSKYEMRLVVLLVLLSPIPWEIQAAYGIHDIGREPDNILYADNGRIRGFSNTRDKDIILAGIIPIHMPQGLTCTNELFMNETLDYVEAFLYSIDAINNDSQLLPGITLGYDIRDSCTSESTAVEETVDLVLLSNSERCQVSCSAQNDLHEQNETSKIPVTGVIGSYASFVSIPIANFLRLFNVLQVSPFSSSPLLSNREQYSYFYRAAPSDDQQIQALIDLLLRFGWKYVSVIHSNDLYGEPGNDRFIELAGRNDICTDLNIGISTTDTETKFQNNIARIYNTTANVVILFASYNVVKDLFDRMLVTMQGAGMQRKFLWIASDASIELITDQPKYERIIAGVWGVIPRTNPEPNFYTYLSQLTLANNNRNPWYGEYYRQFYNCIDVNCSNNAMETITAHPDHRNYSFTPFMIDAVYTFAHAIHGFLHDRCAEPILWNSTARTCVGITDVPSGSILREYLANTSFESPTGVNVIINRETGSTIGVYRILNYQLNNYTGEYQLVTVGVWDGTKSIGPKLTINQSIPLQFGIIQDGRPRSNVVESECQQCPSGSISVRIVSSCCGTCSACVGVQYTPYSNQTQCMNCTDGTWGNNPIRGSNSCLPIAEKYLDASDAWGIFLIILAFFGMGTVIFVSIAFAIYWNTPIVKASGREQMLLLLIGIALCFVSVIFFLIHPSIPICLLQRISLWLFLSLILCSLFVKLVRIARIFLRRQMSTSRPTLIGPIPQIIFTFLLVGVQIFLVVISLVLVYPEPENILELNSQNTNGHPVYLVRCKTPHIALITLQMLYFSVLLIVSNALAMVTIRFPANFREVVYVALSTFCIGIIWIAFVITYFATSNEFQAAIISFAIQMSAFAVLVCMFGPRVLIMIFMPQKNVSKAILLSKAPISILLLLLVKARRQTALHANNGLTMAALGSQKYKGELG